MNFDPVANYYEPLSRTIFGERLLKSKICFLDQIQDDSQILIVGGGTGEELSFLNGKSNRIVFLEPSEKMIKKTKSRSLDLDITYIKKRIEEYSTDIQFDVIICNYFFDLYSDDQLIPVVEKLNRLSHSRSRLFIADFRKTEGQWVSGIYSILLKIMYWFFNATTGLRISRIPEINEVVSKYWEKVAYRERMNGFIWSAVYSKELANPLISR